MAFNRVATNQLRDGFYSSMKEAHYYDASNFEYLDKMWQEACESDLSTFRFPLSTVRQDSDVLPDASIYIGMDYNANINLVTNKGYTKHYYAGTERLATVIGQMAYIFSLSDNEIQSAQCMPFHPKNSFNRLGTCI